MKNYFESFLIFIAGVGLLAGVSAFSYNQFDKQINSPPPTFDLERQMKSIPRVLFVILPLDSPPDTLQLINEHKEFFRYDTISLKMVFNYIPASPSTYTVIGNKGAYTFTSNEYVYTYAIKGSGVNFKRNPKVIHVPTVIVGEPDSLFFRGREMYSD